MATLSHELASRQFDSEFRREVEDAWRARVAPALTEIREIMAEHGLLKDASAIARGDVRRLALEAGGVLAAAAVATPNLTQLVALGAAGTLTAADVIGRAVNERRAGIRDARSSSFYFLYQLEEAARERSM
jgi:hypothetical protein